MKSQAELKDAHDLLCAILSGHLPIVISRKDARMLEAQYHVLCFVIGCESDCFQNSIDSLKELLGRVRILEHGRKYRSKALAE